MESTTPILPPTTILLRVFSEHFFRQAGHECSMYWKRLISVNLGQFEDDTTPLNSVQNEMPAGWVHKKYEHAYAGWVKRGLSWLILLKVHNNLHFHSSFFPNQKLKITVQSQRYRHWNNVYMYPTCTCSIKDE